MILYNPTVSGSLLVTGSLTTTGTLTAQTLVVQTITSSVDFVTGSSVNGSLSSNTHQFTGSVLITGSATTLLSVNNNVLFVSASGNVGIGTSSPSGFGSQKLVVVGSAAGEVARFTDGINADIVFDNPSASVTRITAQYGVSAGVLVFANGTGFTERMRISAAGNVGIGTNTPTNSTLEVRANADTISWGSTSTLYGYLTWGIAASFGENATIIKTPASTGIIFQPAGTEKLRITSGGSVLIGTTTDKAVLTVDGGGASSSKPTLSLRHGGSGLEYTNISGAGDQYHGLILRGIPAGAGDYSATPGDQMSFYEYGADFRFYKKQPGILTNQVKFLEGTIYASNTTVQSISDIRTKENIINNQQGLDVITALRPVRFDFKDGFNEGRKNQLGFIAQEVEEVFPDAVGEWKDDNDGITYKTVGPGALIPVLVKAIQELKAEIDTLKQQQ